MIFAHIGKLQKATNERALILCHLLFARGHSCFAVWYSIYQHYCFENGHLFYLFFVVKNSAVQHCSNVKWCHLIWATVYNVFEDWSVNLSCCVHSYITIVMRGNSALATSSVTLLVAFLLQMLPGMVRFVKIVQFTRCIASCGLKSIVISPYHFLTESDRKRRLNQGSFVLLYFELFAILSCI